MHPTAPSPWGCLQGTPTAALGIKLHRAGCSQLCKRHVFTPCASCKNHTEHPTAIRHPSEPGTGEGKGH
ncbi:hypothetical protein CIB84_015020 [Bambusicola thoracicus]|uniref:Uncharacterized protein n=1 Tax=Bambusicola thoracicus TaxID=9083 RepID=A0A2P4SAU0_BAMTH|nr:hypothetical protein CIB84_015020 [Bambusicola thoracicus]